jgi:hypothetical protein
VQDERHDGTENHHRRREDVEPQAVPAQRGEEARPHLQPDRVHEEDQPELPGELEGVLVHVDAEVAEEEAGEEHTGDAEANATDADGADGEPEPRHEGEDQDRARSRRSVEKRLTHRGGAPSSTP